MDQPPIKYCTDSIYHCRIRKCKYHICNSNGNESIIYCNRKELDCERDKNNNEEK